MKIRAQATRLKWIKTSKGVRAWDGSAHKGASKKLVMTSIRIWFDILKKMCIVSFPIEVDWSVPNFKIWYLGHWQFVGKLIYFNEVVSNCLTQHSAIWPWVGRSTVKQLRPSIFRPDVITLFVFLSRGLLRSRRVRTYVNWSLVACIISRARHRNLGCSFWRQKFRHSFPISGWEALPGHGLLSLLLNGTCDAKNTNLNYNAGLWLRAMNDFRWDELTQPKWNSKTNW